MTCIRAFDAFVNYQNGTEPLEFYGNLKDITEVVKTGWLMASLVIGDALVVSNLYEYLIGSIEICYRYTGCGSSGIAGRGSSFSLSVP